jgi:hypothetical protein
MPRKPKTEAQLERLAKRMVFSIPPVQWPAILDKLSDTEKMTLTRKLDGICGSAALAAGYSGGREYGGHDKDAVKYMNRKYRNVRKALGYSITHDLNF